MQISSTGINYSKPDSTHAEISLFGPGVGECIIINYKKDEWFIIDSCLCPKSKRPIAVEYLEKIGVDLSTKVKGIVITHWHSDHIKGAAELFKLCSDADLFLSQALRSNEFLALVSMYAVDKFSNQESSIKELSEIIEYVKITNQPNRIKPVKNCHSFFNFKNDIRMMALSPSDVSVTQSIVNIESLQATPESPRIKCIVPKGSNFNAVAIHFTFGEFSILLGSDLEESGNTDTGWSSIIDSNIFENQSLKKASLYKVSHHGSSTGDHERIWIDMLKKNPVSITTPFTPSRLPSVENIAYINSKSKEFLIAQNPIPKKKIKRDNMIERELRLIATNRKVINNKMGHIQIRFNSTGEYKITRNENVICCK